jgi:cell division septation protein DedD
MREAVLYKDKIEVSLDGRQIFYLFFGGAVIVGLVFVLGVMVGRRVEARGHVDRARVAATVDPLAALDRLEGGGNLSFQGALRGGDTPASDVEKQIAAMQKAEPATAKKTDKKADEPKAEAKKVEPAHDAPKVDEAKADKKSDKKTDEPKAEKSDKKTDEPKAEKTDKKTDDKKADASNDKPVEEKKQKYTLQLSSFQDRHEAEAYLDSIQASGYEARVTEATVDGKQFYRVRMGTYRSSEAANEAKAEFEKTSKKSAMVTKI